MSQKANGAAPEKNGEAKKDTKTITDPKDLDPAIAEKIAQLRAKTRESFGAVVMSMMILPRYRNQTLADLSHLVLDPLMRDRMAIAYPAKKEDGKQSPLTDIAGVAIWASVSDEVDARIREQISTGTFPIRLKPEEWTSGSINWLLDVIAADKKTGALVISNLKQVVKEGDLRVHPVITRLVKPDVLEKLGMRKMESASDEPQTPPSN